MIILFTEEPPLTGCSSGGEDALWDKRTWGGSLPPSYTTERISASCASAGRLENSDHFLTSR